MSLKWKNFEQYNEGKINDEFESLSYEIFCEIFDVKFGLKRTRNHPILETEPIELKEEICYDKTTFKGFVGFQSKYIESASNFSGFCKQLEDSLKIKYKEQKFSGIENLKNKIPNLDFIVVFCNLDHTENKRYSLMKAYLSDNNIQVIDFFKSNFEFFLEKQNNNYLKLKYFEKNRSIDSFIEDLKTFSNLNKLNENFIHPLYDNSLLIKKIIEDEKDVLFVSGETGSGKTTLMKQLNEKLSDKSIAVSFDFFIDNKINFSNKSFIEREKNNGLKYIIIDDYSENNTKDIKDFFNVFLQLNIKLILISSQKYSSIFNTKQISHIEITLLPQYFIESLNICSKIKDKEKKDLQFPKNLFDFYNKELVENKVNTIKKNDYILKAILSEDFSFYISNNYNDFFSFFEDSILKKNEDGINSFFNVYIENYYYYLLIKSIDSKRIIELLTTKFRNSFPFKNGLIKYIKEYEITDYDNLFFDILDLDDSFSEIKKSVFINVKIEYFRAFLNSENNFFYSLDLIIALIKREDLQKHDYKIIYHLFKNSDIKEFSLKNIYIEILYANMFPYLEKEEQQYIIKKVILSYFDYSFLFTKKEDSFYKDYSKNAGEEKEFYEIEQMAKEGKEQILDEKEKYMFFNANVYKEELIELKSSKIENFEFLNVPFFFECLRKNILFFDDSFFSIFIHNQIRNADKTTIIYAMINEDFVLFEELVFFLLIKMHTQQKLIEQNLNKEIYDCLITLTSHFFNIDIKKSISIIKKCSNRISVDDEYNSYADKLIAAKNKHLYSVYMYNSEILNNLLSDNNDISLFAMKNEALKHSTIENKVIKHHIKKELKNICNKNFYNLTAASLLLFNDFNNIKRSIFVLDRFIKQIDDIHSESKLRQKIFYMERDDYFHVCIILNDFIKSIKLVDKLEHTLFEEFIYKNLKSSSFFNYILSSISISLVSKCKNKKINANLFFKYILQESMFHIDSKNEEENKELFFSKVNNFSTYFSNIDFEFVLKGFLSLHKQKEYKINESEICVISVNSFSFLFLFFEWFKQNNFDTSIVKKDYFQKRFIFILKALIFKLKDDYNCQDFKLFLLIINLLNVKSLDFISHIVKIESKNDIHLLCLFIQNNDFKYNKKLLEFYINLFFSVNDIDKSDYNNIIQEKLDKNSVFSSFKRNEYFRELLKNKENKYDSNMLEYLINNAIENIDKDINYLFFVSHSLLESEHEIILTNENLYLEKILNKDFFENKYYIKNESTIKNVLVYFYKKTDSKNIKDILDYYF